MSQESKAQKKISKTAMITMITFGIIIHAILNIVAFNSGREVLMIIMPVSSLVSALAVVLIVTWDKIFSSEAKTVSHVKSKVALEA